MTDPQPLTGHVCPPECRCLGGCDPQPLTVDWEALYNDLAPLVRDRDSALLAILIRYRNADRDRSTPSDDGLDLTELRATLYAYHNGDTTAGDVIDAADNLLDTAEDPDTCAHPIEARWFVVRLLACGRCGMTWDDPCPVRSSVTNLPCLLREGHPQDSPSRFHHYPRVVGWTTGELAERIIAHPRFRSTPSVDGLREALVKGQRDAESEYRRAQTGTEAEAYHNGRMVAYMDAIEAFDAALAATPTPAPATDVPSDGLRASVPGPGESAGFDRLVDTLRAEFDQGHFIPWDEVIAVVLAATDAAVLDLTEPEDGE